MVRTNKATPAIESISLRINGTVLENSERGPRTLDNGEEVVDKADFEKAIELTKYGKFHYILLAVCGLVSTSEEMDVISMSLIIPSAQCDLHLNIQTKGWLSSIIFIGMMVGAYCWGSMADAVGRKKVLIVISFMNALCIVMSTFSQNYTFFMLFRFLNGVALGGSGPVIWSYFAEFQPKQKRGSMLSLMATFWTLGNLSAACLAWLIIPSGIGYTSGSFHYNSWQIFLMICAVPSFLVGICLIFLPESPKYLLMRRRNKEAMAVFRQIYSSNTGKPPETYPVLDFLYPETVHRVQSDADRIRSMLQKIWENSKQLYRRPILRFTLISIAVNFTFHIGYYGFMMWFPELFNRFKEYDKLHPNQRATLCRVTTFVITADSHSHADLCNDTIEASVFLDSLITVGAATPSNILATLSMDHFGWKFFVLFSTFSAGLCAVGMCLVYNATMNLIVSAVFSGVISCGNAALDCLITEIFPTHLRATGLAIAMATARLGGIIGNIVTATLLDWYCPAPTFIVVGLLFGGGLMGLLLPNTAREPLS